MKKRIISFLLVFIFLFNSVGTNSYAYTFQMTYPSLETEQEYIEDSEKTDGEYQTEQEGTKETVLQTETDLLPETDLAQEIKESEEVVSETETETAASEDAPETTISQQSEDDMSVVIDDGVQSLSLDSYVPPSSIIGEDTSLREANIKYFINEDFSYTAAIYPYAVHYLENGEWKDIDNGLKAVSYANEGNYVQNKANRFKVSFSENTQSGQLVYIDIDDYQVSWSIDTQNRTVQRKLVKNVLDIGKKILPEETAVSGRGEAEIENDTETEKEINETTAEEISLETREFQKNKNQKPKISSETDSSLAPEDKEPVGENTTATLITENPDAAELFEKGDAEALEELEAASASMYNSVITDYSNAADETYTIGLPARQQETYQATLEQNEESLNADYYQEIVQENSEKMALSSLESRVAYNHIDSGVSLEYILTGEKLKENIILASAEANKTFTYMMDLKNLTPELENNEIFFKNSDGETILYIQAPFMYDAKGIRSDAVELSLESKGGQWSIEIAADEAWINDETRQFPVVIDPVISTPLHYSQIKDARVCSNYPNSNFVNDDILSTGYGNNTGDNRSFISFTLPEMEAADIIVNAEMILTCYSEANIQKQVDVHALYEAWNSQTITWNNKPEYDATVIDYAVFKDTLGQRAMFDITDIVKRWYQGLPNNGVMVRDHIEQGNTYTEYLSSDCAAANAAYRPQILITYLNASGLEDFWSYHSQDIGRAGNAYVNDYTGNLVLTHETSHAAGLNMPVNLVHVYNSSVKDKNIGYGNGFRLNYHQTIEPVEISGEDYYRYTDGDGTIHYFYYDDDKSQWIIDSGLKFTLTIGSVSNEKYTVKDTANQKFIFNSSGQLVKIVDNNEQTILIQYTNNRITTISDGADRNFTLTYGNDGNLNKIVSPYGTKTFAYTNNNLTSITDVDNERIKYTYNSHNLLTKVENIDGYNVNYTYTDSEPYRIASIEERAGSTPGQSIDITYGINWNTFTNSNGRKEEYSFNSAGHTNSIVTMDGYAESYKYITEGEHKNRVSKISKMQYPIVQLLKNSNIDSLSSWTKKTEGQTSGSLNSSADNAYLGNTSLKLVSTSGKGYFSQKTNIEKGKAYTFSAFVKPDSTIIENKGAYLQVRYKDNSGKDQYHEARELIPQGDDWYRLICTVSVPSEASDNEIEVYAAADAPGTVYFDCLQLESGKTANRYNLVENTDFREGMDGFTLSGGEAFDQVVDLDDMDGSIPKETVPKGKVTASSLNVRSGAGTGYSVVTSVKLNQIVSIIDEKEDSSGTVWYYIVWSSGQRVYSGYASSDYIDKTGDTSELQNAVITTSTLNVRAGAGTGYSVVTTVSGDTQVKIIQSITSTANQEWYHITFTKNNVRYSGCVLSDYVQTQSSAVDDSLDAPPIHAGGELDNHVLMVHGNPGTVKRASQTLEISGDSGDAYAVNAWGIGESVALKDSRSFGVEVTFNYTDGTQDAFVSNFFDGISDWLFIHDVVIAKKAYDTIKVSYIYGYNENAVYFDGLALYKENYSASFVYDEEGNVISVEDADEKSSNFEYDEHDNISKIIDVNGNDFDYTYDDNSNLISAVSAANVKYTFTNNTYGRPTEVRLVNPSNTQEFIKAKAEYGVLGNFMTATYDPLGNKTSYMYDLGTGLLKTLTDSEGTETDYTYNAIGKTTSVVTDFTDADGDTLSSMCSFSYTDDFLTHIEYHGDVYAFEYDGFGNPTTVKINDTALVSYEYNTENGNRTKVSYGNGQSYTYTYDELNRITEIHYKDASDTQYTLLYSYVYDKNGNTSSATDHSADITYYYYYDLSDRLAKTTDSHGNYLIYEYDNSNNVSKIESNTSSGINVTEYTYDADDRETASKTGNKTFTSAYDALGRIVTKTWNTAKPLTVQYTYTPGAEGSQSALMASYSSNGETTAYAYDSKENITTITGQNGTSKYYYDEINQLYREDNSTINKTILYHYDACGNILKKEIYSKTSAAEVTGIPEKIINYTYADEWRDRMTGYDGQTVTYDAAGNPVTFLGKQMTWFRDQRLQSIQDSTTDVTYSYDEDGFRTKKIDHKAGTTTEYVSDGSLILWEITKNNSGSTVETLAYTYDSYGRIIAFSYNGTPYYYVKNGQGDIVGIVDSSGETVVTYSYDSWGNPVNVEGNTSLAAANPFRYRGYYYDTESGLYYLNSRYYSPETGRFINADDTSMLVDSFEAAADGRNLYAYCNNNPVTYKDSTGEVIDTILDVISLATSVFSVISNPSDPTNWVSVGADIVCLILPGATGGGAAVKAAKNIDKGADVIENFKRTYEYADKVSDVKRMTGSYTIYYASGKVYDGKGGVKRAVTSAKRTRRLPDKSIDTVTGINWSSAPTHRDAFVDEYERMVSHEYELKKNENFYNKIWSPGKKMTHTGLYNSQKHFITFIRRLF